MKAYAQIQKGEMPMSESHRALLKENPGIRVYRFDKAEDVETKAAWFRWGQEMALKAKAAGSRYYTTIGWPSDLELVKAKGLFTPTSSHAPSETDPGFDPLAD